MSVFVFNGEDYRRASRHQKEWGLALIDTIDWRGDEHVLDLGCGDGVLTAEIAARVPRGHAVGLDASASMLEQAREHRVGNLSWWHTPMELVEAKERFDVVFSNAAMHWVLDHDELLRRVRSAIKPGGLLRVNFMAEGNCETFNETVREMMLEPAYRAHFEGFAWPWYQPSPERYHQQLTDAGLTPCGVVAQNRDRHFADVDEMVRWVDQPALVPFLPCLPPSKRSVFREALIERLVDRTRRGDGTCFERFRRVDVTATRSPERTREVSP